MKTILKLAAILILMAIAGGQAHAQDKFIMLYGSLNYNQSKDVSTEFKADPIGVGYSFTDHVVAGLNFAFDHVTNGKGNVLSDKFQVGPFYSYGISIGDHFMLIGQADVHYQWGKGDLDGKVANPVDYNGYLLRVYPIASVLLGKGWALKAKFGEISFSSMRGKNSDHTQAEDFFAGVNDSTIGLGVSKNFTLK